MRYLFLLLLVGCGSEVDQKKDPPVVVTIDTRPHFPEPAPIHEKECTATKTTKIQDCTLYDLICDDGSTDMVFLCPITYTEPSPYIPDPP